MRAPALRVMPNHIPAEIQPGGWLVGPELRFENSPEAATADFRASSKRAEKLLRAHLNPDQLAEWKRERYFRVKGPSGSVYLISGNMGDGYAANVRLESVGRSVRRQRAAATAVDNAWRYKMNVGARLCVGFFYNPQRIPECDKLLAQKLALTASRQSEREFIRMACVS